MRTFSSSNDREAWYRRNKIANFLGGERHYAVEGRITFVFTHHTVEPDLIRLRAAICGVDAACPWRDDIHPDAASLKYITFIGDGTVKVDNWSTPEKSCWFQVVPGWSNLRKAQVYAYEKYVYKLAEELAKMKLHSVAEVRGIIEVVSSKTFKA